MSTVWSSLNPLRRSRAPSESEFLALFQLISDAALLVDGTRDIVLQANLAYYSMTTAAIEDVIGHTTRELFPGLSPAGGTAPLSHSTSGELPPTMPVSLLKNQSDAPQPETHAVLPRRGRSAIAVSVQERTLDPEGRWRVLLVRPLEDEFNRLQSMAERFLLAANTLTESTAHNNNTVAQLAQALKSVYRHETVAVYQARAADGVLCRAACEGDGALLPQTLPANDLLRLAQPLIWKPGRPLLAEVHRFARVHNLTYVATSPLEPKGLVVVTGKELEIPPYLEEVMSTISNWISGTQRLYAQMKDARHSAERAAHESTILRQVINNVNEGIFLLAPDLTIRESNNAAELFLGYTTAEICGQPVENVLIGADGLGPALESALRGIPAHNIGVVSLHRRSGSSFPAQVQVVPAAAADAPPALLIVSFRDISESQEIQLRTQQLEQRAFLGELTAVFAHEVRNPINNISTGLQLLSSKFAPDDPNQEFTMRLIGECLRLDHLMESILNVSRSGNHKLEPVDLEVLMKRLLDRWRPRMAKVNVRHYFYVTPNTPRIIGDARSLEQVFTNLISNAVEAMTQNGGILSVRIEPLALSSRPQVEVTVADDGPGIPQEVMSRIFEPFVTTKPQGTGLGLAITKRSVSANKGSIRVNSFPGGTVFHVLLNAEPGGNAP